MRTLQIRYRGHRPLVVLEDEFLQENSWDEALVAGCSSLVQIGQVFAAYGKETPWIEVELIGGWCDEHRCPDEECTCAEEAHREAFDDRMYGGE